MPFDWLKTGFFEHACETSGMTPEPDLHTATDPSGSEGSARSAVEELLYRAPVGLMTITPAGSVVAHNQMLCEWLGMPADLTTDALVGANAFEWLTAESRSEIAEVIASGLNGAGKLREFMIVGKKLSGERAATILNVDLVTSPSGDPLLHIAMIDANDRMMFEREILEARAAADEANKRLTLMQEQLRYSALHDALTGLPNKALLEEQLRRVLSSSTRSGQACAIVFLDLDHFRQLNAANGYPSGDAVIKEIAKRIRETCHGNEIVSRFAGDEFVIVASPATSDYVQRLTDQLHRAVQLPIFTNDTEMRITTSIGVVRWVPEQGQGAPHARQLFSDVDRAIYTAKLNGRNTTVFREWGCEETRASRGAPVTP